MKIHRLVVGILPLILFGGFDIPVFATPVEQIVNGDFETGDFTGWTITNPGAGNWFINDGTFVTQSPLGSIAPISGSFDAMTDQTGPGTNMLGEPFVVPSGVQSAAVSWNDRIFNWASEFSDPNQEVRVEIRDSTGTFVLGTIFDTNPGDTLSQPGPNIRAFDITTLMQSLEGQTVRLSFTEEDNLLFFNYVIDDVSLTIDTMVIVGGELLPIDNVALVITGLSSVSVWMAPILAVVVGTGFVVLRLKRK
ncbi:MAG TPA: hypothetical protein VJJ25_04045 [Nitrosopumilaceae archaeon]|nr:hypothetical protein [Nitrosopumilaceae archaeon]